MLTPVTFLKSVACLLESVIKIFLLLVFWFLNWWGYKEKINRLKTTCDIMRTNLYTRGIFFLSLSPMKWTQMGTPLLSQKLNIWTLKKWFRHFYSICKSSNSSHVTVQNKYCKCKIIRKWSIIISLYKFIFLDHMKHR